MELNPAYGVYHPGLRWNPAYGQRPDSETYYEINDVLLENHEQTSELHKAIKKSRLLGCVVMGIALIVAFLAVVLAVAAIALVLSTLTNQKIQIEELQEISSQTVNKSQAQNSALISFEEELSDLRNDLSTIGSLSNPAGSCRDIKPDSPSGEFWIQTRFTDSPFRMYCDMTKRCCKRTSGGWTRIANLNMSDPSQQCPDGFQLVNRTTAPLRTCGRPEGAEECISTIFQTLGMRYSRVCGKIIGYQYGTAPAFGTYFYNKSITIDGFYAGGVSLTHGQSPRHHIWTFAASLDEHDFPSTANCPCITPVINFPDVVPPFIGQDYFCATGVRQDAIVQRDTFYSEDPLWDGQGCTGVNTCCSLNTPPNFCKELPQPTTDDIELRLCGSQHNGSDTPLETVDIYIQ